MAHKFAYTKDNVISKLLEKEQEYNEKWVKAVNAHDKKEEVAYLMAKSVIQNLIIDFEEEFE